MLWSWPNILTIVRVGLVPLMVACFYFPGPEARLIGCGIFVAAAITDYLDGYLARYWKQQSAFGRWLDPVADKILVAAAVIMLVGFGEAPLLPALVIIAREIMISGLREYMAEVSVGLPVSRLAKWKTGVQMAAICCLIAGNAAPHWLYAAEIGWWGLWGAALLTLVTGWDYLQAGLRHMLADKLDGKDKDPPGQQRTAERVAATHGS
ncbi:cardiolipin synthase [Arboricoccus pini]|uniref:CDP-diacylglycerol--glycerol-3-phosphate 3-phosphatidyltransferase n=1 Tax=Arboricoccus pini TaxID=1963835 RepID=A0A212RDM0_9PROT|nr:CDP-diacylglycerol--glycerol-3-phosphate 3-phosphatidyltransferase [Arboricoccus pini]SNB70395.1 cardiolipin synthase [Arboricoccus pini]